MAGRERLSQPRGGDILLSDSASSSSDEESLRMAKQVVPYSKEPEWTEAELLAHVAESESSATEEEVDGDGILGDWPPASRVGNKEWCFCGECDAMAVRHECICCHEYEESKKKLSDGGVKCISFLSKFATVCLDRDVLETALTGFLDLTKRPLNTPASNE